MPKERKAEKLEELNLTPIMSILVILIPILLFAFTFFEIKIQAVAAPRMGSSKSKSDEDKKPLNLTVLITEKDFKIKQQAEIMEEPERPIPKRTFEFEGNTIEEYDYPALYTRLMEFKKKYPDEEIINIGASPTIPWRHVATTIDCARSQLADPAYEELEAFAKAPVKTSGTGETLDLFPKVVFVVAE